MAETRYLTKTTWEKNATNGLELHQTLTAALSSASDDITCGAVNVRLFRCEEVAIKAETSTRVTMKLRE